MVHVCAPSQHLFEVLLDTFFERLREERQRLGISQTAFAELAGVQKRAQINYESGERSPDAAYLAAIAAEGVDVLYLLTGTPAAKAKVAVVTPGQISLDRSRFTAAMVAVEEGLTETRRTLPPKKKIELYLAAYALMAQAGQSRDNVIKLVRMAA